MSDASDADSVLGSLTREQKIAKLLNAYGLDVKITTVNGSPTHLTESHRAPEGTNRLNVEVCVRFVEMGGTRPAIEFHFQPIPNDEEWLPVIRAFEKSGFMNPSKNAISSIFDRINGNVFHITNPNLDEHLDEYLGKVKPTETARKPTGGFVDKTTKNSRNNTGKNTPGA